MGPATAGCWACSLRQWRLQPTACDRACPRHRRRSPASRWSRRRSGSRCRRASTVTLTRSLRGSTRGSLTRRSRGRYVLNLAGCELANSYLSIVCNCNAPSNAPSNALCNALRLRTKRRCAQWIRSATVTLAARATTIFSLGSTRWCTM